MYFLHNLTCDTWLLVLRESLSLSDLCFSLRCPHSYGHKESLIKYWFFFCKWINISFFCPKKKSKNFKYLDSVLAVERCEPEVGKTSEWRILLLKGTGVMVLAWDCPGMVSLARAPKTTALNRSLDEVESDQEMGYLTWNTGSANRAT